MLRQEWKGSLYLDSLCFQKTLSAWAVINKAQKESESFVSLFAHPSNIVRRIYSVVKQTRCAAQLSCTDMRGVGSTVYDYEAERGCWVMWKVYVHTDWLEKQIFKNIWAYRDYRSFWGLGVSLNVL